MRQRGFSTLGTILLSAVAGLFAAAALSDWVVVDVTTTGPDGVHLVIPFPLAVGHLAAWAVPDDALADASLPPEVASQRDAVLNALEALDDCPDAVLVEVRTEAEHVVISKSGDELVLAVDADDAVVRAAIPVAGVREALDDWDWQTAEPGVLFDILGSARSGELVSVDADEARVSIRMW